MMHEWQPTERLDTILDTCIDQLDTAPPEEVLRRYPHSAQTLAPLLQVAETLREMGDLQLSPQAHAAGRARLRAAVLAKQRRSRRPPLARRAMHMAVWAALMLIMFGTGLSAVTVASASALPNDRLYGWKRGCERAWLRVQPSPERAASTALWVSNRRVQEMKQLYLRDGKVDSTTVAELKRQYQQTLALIGAAPSAQEQTLLVSFHELSQTHTQELSEIAQVGNDQGRQTLLAAVQLSQWAQTATPPQEPGTAPPAPEPSNETGQPGTVTPTTPGGSSATAVPPSAQPQRVPVVPTSSSTEPAPTVEAATDVPAKPSVPAAPRASVTPRAPRPTVEPGLPSIPATPTEPGNQNPGPPNIPGPPPDPGNPNPGPTSDPGPPADPGNPNPGNPNPGNPNPGPTSDPGPPADPGNPNPGNPNPGPTSDPGPPADPGNPNPGNPNPGPPSDPGPPADPGNPNPGNPPKGPKP